MWIFPSQGGTLRRVAVCEGKSTRSCEARFFPSRSPFPGTQLLYGYGEWKSTGGAMDAAMLKDVRLSRRVAMYYSSR